MEFVVASLIEIFEHDIDTAESLTEKVHNEGSAVIAVLPYEIAEHKGVETTILARSNGYPLQVKIEPE
jgi:ATP-dependent Clp protease adaptor protein ClpS